MSLILKTQSYNQQVSELIFNYMHLASKSMAQPQCHTTSADLDVRAFSGPRPSLKGGHTRIDLIQNGSHSVPAIIG